MRGIMYRIQHREEKGYPVLEDFLPGEFPSTPRFLRALKRRLLEPWVPPRHPPHVTACLGASGTRWPAVISGSCSRPGLSFLLLSTRPAEFYHTILFREDLWLRLRPLCEGVEAVPVDFSLRSSERPDERPEYFYVLRADSPHLRTHGNALLVSAEARAIISELDAPNVRFLLAGPR